MAKSKTVDPPADSPEPMRPSDVAPPSATDDVTNKGDEADPRPTAREGLKPVGNELPHPTAAARLGRSVSDIGIPADVVPARPPRTAKPIRVRATQAGYYGDKRQRPGDVFLIDGTVLDEDVLDGTGKVVRSKGDVADFSERWMEPVDESVQVRTTTPNESIRKRHDEILGGRVTGNRSGEDAGAGDDNPLNAD